MDNVLIENVVSFDIDDKLYYMPTAIIEITIFKKRDAEIRAMAFAEDMIKKSKTGNSAVYFEVLEGRVEVSYDKDTITLSKGNSLIIPNYTEYGIKAIERSKMLSITTNLNLQNIHSNHESTKGTFYKAGDTVYAKAHPEKALIIRIFANKIYYCYVKDNPDESEEVYFERELI